MWEIVSCGANLIMLAILLWLARDYIRLRRWVMYCRMECDDIIDQLISLPSTEPSTEPKEQWRRERLAALAAGGQARQYLAKDYSVEQIESMGFEDIERLYTRYEARLGAAMTKTLGQAALQLYTSIASMALPIPPRNRPKLLADLEADPFVGHALSRAACELYHRYGTYMAPITAVLTTIRHCELELGCPRTVADGDRPSVESVQQDVELCSADVERDVQKGASI